MKKKILPIDYLLSMILMTCVLFLTALPPETHGGDRVTRDKEGWCCSQGKVTAADRVVCERYQGIFFDLKEDAKRECRDSPRIPVPEKLHQAPEPPAASPRSKDRDTSPPEAQEQNDDQQIPHDRVKKRDPEKEKHDIDLRVEQVRLDKRQYRTGDTVRVVAELSANGKRRVVTCSIVYMLEGRQVGKGSVTLRSPGGKAQARSQFKVVDPGDQGLIVILDPENRVEDSNESNNQGEALLRVVEEEGPAEYRADKTIQRGTGEGKGTVEQLADISIEKKSLGFEKRKGENIPVLKLRIHNRGPADVKRVELNASIEGSNKKNLSITRLSRGQTRNIDITFDPVEPGEHGVFAEVHIESGSKVEDPEPGNNMVEDIISNLPEGERIFTADLSVKTVEVEKKVTEDGGTALLLFEISNNGPDDSPGSRLAVRIEEDLIRELQGIDLAKGQKKLVKIVTPLQPFGDHAVFANILPDLRNNIEDIILENNHTDLVLSLFPEGEGEESPPKLIEAPGAGLKPDLKPFVETIKGTFFGKLVEVTITNAGGAASLKSKVGFCQAADVNKKTISWNGIAEVPPLGPGNSIKITIPNQIVGLLSENTKYAAVVDIEDSVAEGKTGEKNNVSVPFKRYPYSMPKWKIGGAVKIGPGGLTIPPPQAGFIIFTPNSHFGFAKGALQDIVFDHNAALSKETISYMNDYIRFVLYDKNGKETVTIAENVLLDKNPGKKKWMWAVPTDIPNGKYWIRMETMDEDYYGKSGLFDIYESTIAASEKLSGKEAGTVPPGSIKKADEGPGKKSSSSSGSGMIKIANPGQSSINITKPSAPIYVTWGNTVSLEWKCSSDINQVEIKLEYAGTGKNIGTLVPKASCNSGKASVCKWYIDKSIPMGKYQLSLDPIDPGIKLPLGFIGTSSVSYPIEVGPSIVKPEVAATSPLSPYPNEPKRLEVLLPEEWNHWQPGKTQLVVWKADTDMKGSPITIKVKKFKGITGQIIAAGVANSGKSGKWKLKKLDPSIKPGIYIVTVETKDGKFMGSGGPITIGSATEKPIIPEIDFLIPRNGSVVSSKITMYWYMLGGPELAGVPVETTIEKIEEILYQENKAHFIKGIGQSNCVSSMNDKAVQNGLPIGMNCDNAGKSTITTGWPIPTKLPSGWYRIRVRVKMKIKSTQESVFLQGDSPRFYITNSGGIPSHSAPAAGELATLVSSIPGMEIIEPKSNTVWKSPGKGAIRVKVKNHYSFFQTSGFNQTWATLLGDDGKGIPVPFPHPFKAPGMSTSIPLPHLSPITGGGWGTDIKIPEGVTCKSCRLRIEDYSGSYRLESEPFTITGKMNSKIANEPDKAETISAGPPKLICNVKTKENNYVSDGKSIKVTVANIGQSPAISFQYKIGYRPAGSKTSIMSNSTGGADLKTGEKKEISLPYPPIVESMKKPDNSTQILKTPDHWQKETTSKQMYEVVVDYENAFGKSAICGPFSVTIPPKGKIETPEPLPAPDLEIISPTASSVWQKGANGEVIWKCIDPDVCRQPIAIELYHATTNNLVSKTSWVGTGSNQYPKGFKAKQKMKIPLGAADGSYYVKLRDSMVYSGGKPPTYSSQNFSIATSKSNMYPYGQFTIKGIKGISSSGKYGLSFTVEIGQNSSGDFKIGDYGHALYGSQYLTVRIENPVYDKNSGKVKGSVAYQYLHSVKGGGGTKTFSSYPSGTIKAGQSYTFGVDVSPILGKLHDLKLIFNSAANTNIYSPKLTVALTTYTNKNNKWIQSETKPYTIFLDGMTISNLPITEVKTGKNVTYPFIGGPAKW